MWGSLIVRPQGNYMTDPIDKSLEIAKKYIDKIVDAPLKELGGLLADKVNYWRFKNKINTILKAKKFLEDKGIDPKKALPETVVPLLESSSDTEDDNLSDMFAGLLASHLSAKSSSVVHPSYAKVLSQLAPSDAYLLRELHKRITNSGKAYNSVGFTLESASDILQVPSNVALLSFQNIWRLGICSHGSGLDHLNQKEQIVFTDYGWAMLQACEAADI